MLQCDSCFGIAVYRNLIAIIKYILYHYFQNESECDSYTEENERSFLLKDYRAPGTQTDFTNEEYYRKLEELKNAHLDTMAQLEKMYQNKLKLKGVVAPDNEYDKTELHGRYIKQFRCYTYLPFHPNIVGIDLFGNDDCKDHIALSYCTVFTFPS